MEFKYSLKPEGMDYLEKQTTEKLIQDRKYLKELRKVAHESMRKSGYNIWDSKLIKYFSDDIKLITSEINYRAGMKRVECHGGGIYG